MSYSEDYGFLSRTVEQIKDDFRLAVNRETGSSYTSISFTDSSWDRIANVLAQVVAQGEQTMEAGWDNVRSYISVLNQSLGKPYSSIMGLMNYFNEEIKIGTKIKQPTEEEAGKIFLAFDLDEDGFIEKKDVITKALIDRNILNFFFEGEKQWHAKLPNNQDWLFACQLATPLEVYIDIRIIRSRNSEYVALDELSIKNLFVKNLEERFTIGEDGEWGRVLSFEDLPWAGNISIGYKDLEEEPTYIYRQKVAKYYERIKTSVDKINVVISDI